MIDVLAVPLLALTAFLCVVGGRRFAWGWLAICVPIYVLPPLGVSFLIAWGIGIVLNVVVSDLPIWRDDPPQRYMAMTCRALASPWKARQAWRRYAERGTLNGLVFAAPVRAPEQITNGHPLPLVIPRSGRGPLVVVEIVQGRRFAVILADLGPPQPRGGRRKRRRSGVKVGRERLTLPAVL